MLTGRQRHPSVLSLIVNLTLSHPSFRTITFDDIFARFIAKFKRKRKALLIGCQSFRDLPSSPAQETPSHKPDDDLLDDAIPSATARGKSKKKKVMNDHAEIQTLRGPHKDVECMRSLLIDVYSYHPDDIVVLIDDNDPNHSQPTKRNILNAIDELVNDACEGDKFFFLYAGHAKQEDSDPNDHDEEDGKDEYIIPSDNKHIKDDELRIHLVYPLPPGCFLTVVFDCCHSGTLLDLYHVRCNRVYVPWINKGIRRSRTLWTRIVRRFERARSTFQQSKQILQALTTRSGSGAGDSLKSTPKCNTLSLRINTGVSSGAQLVMSPESLFCEGFCREDKELMKVKPRMAHVVCLSSSKDHQLTYEDENGMSMTQHLVKILEDHPERTFSDLLTIVSHKIYKYYLNHLHQDGWTHKKEIRAKNQRRERNGRSLIPRHEIETNNFQNPQISTHHPLDLESYFEP